MVSTELDPTGTTDLERSEVLRAADELIDRFLAGRPASTARAYRRDLDTYATHLGIETSAAVAATLGNPAGTANALVAGWRDAMLDADLAPATVNRRLSTIRSLVTCAAEWGLVDWTLTVAGTRSAKYRDTTGPGLDAVAAMMGTCDTTTAIGARDLAMLRLMFDRGLRRGEVVALDIEDLDLETCQVQITAKGHREPTWVTVGQRACNAIETWLDHRGTHPGPLFVNLGRGAATKGQTGQRITGRSVARLVERASTKADVGHVRPHGLRHTAITTALDTGGDLRQVARFSRHADLRTVVLYDDNRDDLGGKLAESVAAMVDVRT